MSAIRIQVNAGSDTCVLSQDGGFVDVDGRFRVACFADGVDLGDPGQRTVTVPWAGADGDRVEVEGYSNRTQKFEVKVTSLTGAADGLEAGEAWLSRVVGRPAEMSWTAPAAGRTSVYEWETSRLAFKLDDQDELDSRPRRVFVLTAEVRPFARAVDLTVVSAIGTGTGTTPTPTVTVLQTPAAPFTGWTATDWTNNEPVSMTVKAGNATPPTGVTHHHSGLGPYWYVDLTYTGTLVLGWDRWLRVRHLAWGSVMTFTGIIAKTSTGDLLTMAPSMLVDSYAYFEFPPSTTLTEIHFIVPRASGLVVFEIARQNHPPVLSSGKQLPRAFQVAGSARTPISMTVAHTAGVGDLLAFLRPEDGSGNSPAMRRYRTSTATAVADTSAVTGSRIDLVANDVETYEPPAASMPESTYAILARIRPTSTAGMSWTLTASTVVAGVAQGVWTSSPMWREGTAAGAWTYVDLGLITLPTVKVPEDARVSSTAKVRVTLSASAAIALDEVWLMDIARGQVLRVAAGAAKKVRVDAPTLDTPRPTVYVSDLASPTDWSDGRHVAQAALTLPKDGFRGTPGTMNLLTVCASENAAVSMSYYERALHHVAGVL